MLVFESNFIVLGSLFLDSVRQQLLNPSTTKNVSFYKNPPFRFYEFHANERQPGDVLLLNYKKKLLFGGKVFMELFQIDTLLVKHRKDVFFFFHALVT